MTYTANPDDATQPLDGVSAKTAAAEFRALKQKLNTTILTAGNRPLPRQSVFAGAVDSNGQVAYLSAGTGLKCTLLATTTNVYLTHAAGFNNAGPVDYISVLSSDRTDYWTLYASTRSFLAIASDGVSTLTPYVTKARPSYGYAYPKDAASLVPFDGTVNSTTFVDSFGNTWTASGGAKLQSTVAKFGATALGGGGIANALNGSADYAYTDSINSLNGEGWTIRTWIRPTALPGPGVYATAVAATAATDTNAFELGLYNDGGVVKAYFSLAYALASYDLVNTQKGTSAIPADAWTLLELTYDGVADTYRLYVNGTQEATYAAGAGKRVNGFRRLVLGCTYVASAARYFTGYIDAFELLPYCDHPGGVAYIPAAAAQDISAAGYAAEYFDLNTMRMYAVTGASATAGTVPTLTAKLGLYVGEVVSSGAAPTSIISYALGGKCRVYSSVLTNAANATSLTHGLGCMPGAVTPWIELLSGLGGYVPGTKIPFSSMHSSTSVGGTVSVTATAVTLVNTNGSYIYVYDKITGASTLGQWKSSARYIVDVARGW